MEAILNVPEPTRIQDLPSELLLEIFRRIQVQRESDIDHLQNVCRYWYNIIDKWMGTAVTTSTERVIHPSNPNLSKRGLELISEIGVNFLHIKRRHGYLPEEQPTILPHFKYPYLLKHLRLNGIILPDVFKNLVKGTINLSILDLSLTSLAQLRNSDLKDLNLQRLNKLRVSGGHSEAGESALQFLPNCLTLLNENNFPWLTRLGVGFPVLTVNDLGLIRAIIAFLHRHCQMEKLSVETKDSSAEEEAPTYRDDLDAIISDVRSSDCRSLKVLKVGRTWNDGHYPHLEILKELAMRQTSLQSLDINDYTGLNLIKTIKEISTRFGSTLMTLRICGINSDHIDLGLETDWFHLHCTVFSPLKVLRNLYLSGDDFRITGTRNLPHSLVALDCMASLNSNELEHILLECPKLRYVTIYKHKGRDEEEEEDKLSLEMFQQFIQKKEDETFRFPMRNC